MNKDDMLEDLGKVTGAALSIILVCLIFHGIQWQCSTWAEQGKAEWQQKMDFAKNAGGVYEPRQESVVFPDGKVLMLRGL